MGSKSDVGADRASSIASGPSGSADRNTPGPSNRSTNSSAEEPAGLRPAFPLADTVKANTRLELDVADDRFVRPALPRRISSDSSSDHSKDHSKSKTRDPFKVSKTIMETEHKSPIYTVSFNPYQDENAPPMFATAAKNTIHIYTMDSHSKNFTLMRTVVDDLPDESFFTVAWTYDSVANKHKLAVGGYSGNIKIIDPEEGFMYEEFLGHGDVVNEIRTDPNNSMLFASVSKDTTVRVWNNRIDECLIIFGGQDGHNDQVLSCDWSPDSDFIISCGMDHSIRMWRLNEACRRLINHSMTPEGEKEIRSHRKTDVLENPLCIQIQFPNAWTNDLHCDYVDCARFISWYIVSKGSEKAANIFRFGHVDEPVDQIFSVKPDTACTLIHQLQLPDCDVWFLKFDVDPQSRWLVFGTKSGKLYIFDLHILINGADMFHEPDFVISISNRAVRQVCFDPSGNVLLAVTDSYQIIRLDRLPEGSSKPFKPSSSGATAVKKPRD